MITIWQNFLRAKAESWGLPQGGEWTYLFHNNYHPHCSSINLLWFYNRDPFPSVVTKLYREPAIIEREFANLRQVHATVPQLAPRPLHFGRVEKFWTLWMAGLPGYRVETGASYSGRTLQSISDAIVPLHLNLQKPNGSADPERYRRMVLEPFDTLYRFGESSFIRNGCTEMAKRISAAWLASMPIIPQHGDLFAGNLLSYKKRLYIVDWETFGLIDLPLYDLLTLCISFRQTNPDAPDQWPSSFIRRSPTVIRRYCAALRLSSQDVKLLLPLTLANWLHLQWTDGRREFCDLLYRSIDQYFRHPAMWEEMTCGKTSNPHVQG